MGTRNLGGADAYNKMLQMNNGITNSTFSLVSLHLMVHCCLTLPQFLKRKNTRRIATPPPGGCTNSWSFAGPGLPRGCTSPRGLSCRLLATLFRLKRTHSPKTRKGTAASPL